MKKIIENLKNQQIYPYFENDNFVLYLEDSLELLPKFPEGIFDMIFADPPYLLSNGGFTCQAGKRVSVNNSA